MAPALMIALYVQSELSYDRFRPHSDRVYRILRETRWPSGRIQWSTGQKGALASALRENFEEVEEATRFWAVSSWVSSGDTGFRQRFCLADRNILEFFGIEVLYGDPESVLSKPSSVVLTREMAQKYFGTENPIGKIITAERLYFGSVDLRVTGILADMPSNSHFKFDFITATPTNYIRTQQLWDVWKKSGITTPAHTYLRIAEGFSASAIERKLPDLLAMHLGRGRGEHEGTENFYHLQPLNRIHLYSGLDYGYRRGGRGDIGSLYQLITIGTFVLIIACINLMNLATARATNRLREIGMRKAMGASRHQLIIQFLGESVFLSGLAMLFALFIAALLLPDFTVFVGGGLSLDLITNSTAPIWLIGIVLFAGLLSGGYAAFFMSGFQPAAALRGISKTGSSAVWCRKSLVVLQFAIATLLIICTFAVYRQLEYISHRDLGFDDEHVVVMPIFDNTQLMIAEKSTLSKKYHIVKQEFLKHPNVTMATASRGIPGGLRSGSYAPTLKVEDGREIEVRMFDVDVDFIRFFDLSLVSGRSFSDEDADSWRGNSEISYIITETTAENLRWEDPIGESLRGRGHLSQGRVIGVIEDFHLDLRHRIEPVVLTVSPVRLRYLSLKVRTEALTETMSFLKATWKRFVPDRPFNYHFLDERIDSLYRREVRHGQMFAFGAFLAIFVACLGLLGYASFTAKERTREIGIRKVSGASVTSIVVLLVSDNLKWVVIANAVAWPIAYLVSSSWLERFAYRIDLGLDPFVLGGCTVLFIATLTTGYLALKAATANPVDSLRWE